MIQFNNLEFVSPTLLRIDAEVMDLPYFDNVTIDRIIIDTEDTVCENGPSSNPPFVMEWGDGTAKDIKTTINVSDLVKDGPKLLFVYIKCLGNPYPEPPCPLDKEYPMQAVADMSQIYETALKFAKCTKGCGCNCQGPNCQIDVNFANFALQYFRFSTAMNNKDWATAYESYCYLMRRRNKKAKINVPPSKPCGCNG